MNEVDLTQLLKDFKEIKFFSTLFGDTEIVKIYPEDCIDICPYGCPTEIATLFANGRFGKDGIIVLYPSRALYEKYPLDAAKAWREWQESRKPKRWRAKCYDRYWRLNSMGMPKENQDVYCHDGVDQLRYEFGNYFRTEEEAQQAAEAVRECLMKFHEQNAEK